MRRMAMGAGAFESPALGAPSRYFKHTALFATNGTGTFEVEVRFFSGIFLKIALKHVKTAIFEDKVYPI